MRHRLTGALCVALLVALAPTSHAKPARSCRLITDFANDHQGYSELPGPDPTRSGAQDILSADIASDAKRVTAVIRTGELSDAFPATNNEYRVLFTVVETTFVLQARYGGLETVYTLHRSNGGVSAGNSTGSASTYSMPVIAQVTGHIDRARREVRITAPLSAFNAHQRINRGQPLRNLAAETWIYIGTVHSPKLTGDGGGWSQSDAATTRATYAAGAPSCVRVGS
jgi:hypothetical protein